MKTKTPKWIKIIDGVIADIHVSFTEQPDMVKVPWNSDVKLNTKAAWYDENWKRKKFDMRGKYWSTANYRVLVEINKLGIEPPPGFTDIPPIEGEPCVWNGEGWDVDEEKKEYLTAVESEKTCQNRLDKTDYKVIQAAERGQVLSQINPGLSAEREQCRVKINEARRKISLYKERGDVV
jgi:hypothetical protein